MRITKLGFLFCCFFALSAFAKNDPITSFRLPSAEIVAPPTCDFPAPTNIQVKDISASWVGLEWTATGPPPAQYQIKTYIASTNQLISTVTAPGWTTTWRVFGLPAGETCYSTIAGICNDNTVSRFFGQSANFKVLVVDLIVTGFTPNTSVETCTMGEINGIQYVSCEFPSATNVITTFKIRNVNAQEQPVSYLGIKKLPTSGEYRMELTGYNSNSGYSFLCNNNIPPNPSCMSGQVHILYNNVEIANLTVVFSAGGISLLYANYLNSNYFITKMGTSSSPNFNESNDRFSESLNSVSPFSVAPNPFNDHLEVQLHYPEETDAVALHLYDLQGRLVFTRITTGGEQIETLPTETLLPGMYFLRVDAGGETKSVKVVKTQ